MSIFALTAASAIFQLAPCGLEGVPAGFEQANGVECGWVSVPRDGKSGKSIRLWAARARATGPSRREDPILYIHGGPGIATVDSVLPGAASSPTMKMLRQDRDIIMFDQRGSGRSEEALCPYLAKTLNGISQSGLSSEAEEERGRAAFAACGVQLKQSGIDIDAYSTASTVNDMEAVRQAFAVDKWNLLSVSYGTLVALHAMRTHPASVRSAILNSPYPPNSASWAEQASTAASAYQAIARACSAQAECSTRFGDLVPKLEAVLARLEREPIKDGEKLITGRQFASAIWPLAVRSTTVRFVPLAINRAHSGDDALIKKLVATFASGDSFGGLSPAQAYAIGCYEGGRTRDWYVRAKALYPALVSDAPADSMDRTCEAFRPGHADAAFFAPVASDIPTLIYAGSLDPATPVIDAYQTIRFLPRATLVEVEGAAHAPAGLDDCTRGIAVAFLSRPEAGPDTSCIAQRKREPFATAGLDEFLASGS